jgi:hypothetical protein
MPDDTLILVGDKMVEIHKLATLAPAESRRLGAALKLPLRLRLSGLLGRDRGSAVGVRREQNLDAATLVSGHQVARCRWAFLAENAHAIPAQSLIAKGIICEVRD